MASAAGTDDVDAQLARLDSPPELEPLPPVSPLARAYANPAVHRLYPAAAGFAMARARAGVLGRLRPAVRADDLRAMEYVVGRSSRAGEAGSLAVKHAYETAKRSEYLWRPWLTSRLALEGAEEARRFAEGAGATMITFMHHGPYVGLTQAVQRAGISHFAPINDFFFTTPSPGFRGHRDRQHMQTLLAGARCFSATGTVPMMARVLERGQTLGLAIDIPGKTDATFLGRPVKMAPGAAMLAFQFKAPIQPLTLHPARGTTTLGTVRFELPIITSDFASPDELHAEIVRRHEPAVLAWPEALEWPLQRWAPAEPEDAAYFGFDAA